MEPNPGPLTRRLMLAVRFLSLLLILVVANSFLNGGEASLNPIAVAAEHTESQPGARFTMKAIYTSPGPPEPMVAHGREPATRKPDAAAQP